MTILSVSTTFILIAVFVCRAQNTEVPCFAPDGITVAPNDSFVPCNKLGITQQGVHSSCCLLDGDSSNRDLCATSGLCVNGGIVRREFCTDKTWKSPACVSVCLDPTWGGSRNSSVELTPCTDGKFCCGHNNLTCCGTEWAFSVPSQVNLDMMNTSSIVPTSPPSGPNTAAIGIGVALGVVLLLAAGLIFYLYRQNTTLTNDNKTLAASTIFRNETFRPVSYIPALSDSEPTSTTLGPGSTHVPSMQEFAAFKAMYGSAIEQHMREQQQQEQGRNPNRLSELDGIAVRNSGIPPGVFEQIREVSETERSAGVANPTTPRTAARNSYYGAAFGM